MKRTLDDLPIDLALYNTIKGGGGPIGPGSFKKQLGPSWRKSIRSVGGFWLATANYDGPAYQMMDMFLGGLCWEVRETLGNLITWQGFVGKMVLTLGGVQYERRWDDIANRVQVIYTRLGDNLLNNGSGESAPWTALATPTTLAQSTAWITDGQYSMHIITDAGSEGAIVQTGMTIVANKAYELQVSVNIISGNWNFDVYRTDTTAALATAVENTTGQKVMRVTVPDTNTYAGTVGVRLYTPGAGSGEIYADGAVFREAGAQARTSWYADSASAADYGTIEESILLAGMSDAAANAHANTYLKAHAWPRTVAPDSFVLRAMPLDDIKLSITFYGYVFTLRNKYTTRGGTTQNASVHAANLVADSEFITAGSIEANTLQYQIEDRAPLRAWEVLRDMTRAGDAAGRRWNCGVYEDRRFDYGPAAVVPEYRYQGGMATAALMKRQAGGQPQLEPVGLQNLSGGNLDPWLARPGLVYLDNLPVGPGDLSGDDTDDPHALYMEQVEFSAADWLAGGSGLSFKREAVND